MSVPEPPARKICALSAPGMALGLSVLLGLGMPAAGGAQATPPDSTAAAPAPPAAPAPGDTVARLDVVTRAQSPVAAMALAFPHGSGDDPEGASGAASLLARAMERDLGETAATRHALLSSRVEVDRTTLTMVVPPEELEAAWTAFRAALETPLPDGAIEAAREDLLGPLRFERGAPVRLFELEFDRLVLGVTHPWARPTQGTEAGLESISPSALRELQARWLRLDEARLSVVGPRTPAEMARLVAGAGAGLPPRSADVPPAPPNGEGTRVVLERDVVNSWVAVAWPVTGSVPRTSLEFTAHVLRELLTPSLPDPGLFSVTTRVDDLPGGPVLRVVVAVEPGSVARWEQQVLGAMAGLRDQPPPDDFLSLFRRRFASEVLLRESLPEVEAARRAGDLLHLGEARDLADGVRELGGEDLGATVGALGAPWVLLYGPGERGGGS